MHKKSILIMCLMMLVSAVAQGEGTGDEIRIIVFYDSEIHQITEVPTLFLVTKIDVSKSRRIEESINKRLQFKGKADSVEQIDEWALKRIQSDPEIKRLMNEIPKSYEYMNYVQDIGLSKVPAVVLRDGEDDFVIYGETNISKAIKTVYSYRKSAMP